MGSPAAFGIGLATRDARSGRLLDAWFPSLGLDGERARALAALVPGQGTRSVELDAVSRQQQVRDGCFETLDAVPTHAITLTVPAIMAARSIRCIVPGRHKAEAVLRTLRGPVEPACPASVLRTHADAELFLDAGSGALVGGWRERW